MIPLAIAVKFAAIWAIKKVVVFGAAKTYGFHRIYRRSIELTNKVVHSRTQRERIQGMVKSTMRFPRVLHKAIKARVYSGDAADGAVAVTSQKAAKPKELGNNHPAKVESIGRMKRPSLPAAQPPKSFIVPKLEDKGNVSRSSRLFSSMRADFLGPFQGRGVHVRGGVYGSCSPLISNVLSGAAVDAARFKAARSALGISFSHSFTSGMAAGGILPSV
eukprot:jgi/Mesvir1/16304/Mv14231-RA.1